MNGKCPILARLLENTHDRLEEILMDLDWIFSVCQKILSFYGDMFLVAMGLH